MANAFSVDTPLFDWLSKRSAGVLSHISSLPSETGIGNLGINAYRFIDFLSNSGIKIWQICPLGPTGYGDSPYQSFSAFAGNPYFIDLSALLDEGLITNDEIKRFKCLPHEYVDYGKLHELFWPVLRSAFLRFKKSKKNHLLDYGSIAAFRKKQSYWIEDYAHFMALKDLFGGNCWLDWPMEYRDSKKVISNDLSSDISDSVNAHIFYQYLFYAQLNKLRTYARTCSVEIMGDAPIFVSMDSADVWANPELFQLNDNGTAQYVAGVPPDYFSSDGQLWGNPLYKWSAHEATEFKWWIQRIQSNHEFYDIVRLDHFRGFSSYWSVEAAAKNARVGQWIPCPGLALFKAIRDSLPKAKMVAEDLGVITDDVIKLRHATGLPGMAVLQFAFGTDADNDYLPHNHKSNCATYTGTHDNDTTIGWYQSLDKSTQDRVRRYLGVSGEAIAWDFIRATIKSCSHMAFFPLQDLLSLNSEARLNTPGSHQGNWKWRYLSSQLNELELKSSSYLREQLFIFGR